MTGYDLSRDFWNFSFDHPDEVKPLHIAIYFFAIEHCNRLGWKEKFGFPTSMVLDAIGLKSYKSYKKAFDELVKWGFFIVIEYSKNQYSSNIIALNKKTKARTKALDKALQKHALKHAPKHAPKQDQSTHQSTASINKQGTRNKEQGTKNKEQEQEFFSLKTKKEKEETLKPPPVSVFIARSKNILREWGEKHLRDYDQLTAADEYALASIEKFIRSKIAAQKKESGYTNWAVTPEETVEAFEIFLNAIPENAEWVMQYFSLNYLSKEIVKIYNDVKRGPKIKQGLTRDEEAAIDAILR